VPGQAVLIGEDHSLLKIAAVVTPPGFLQGLVRREQFQISFVQITPGRIKGIALVVV